MIVIEPCLASVHAVRCAVPTFLGGGSRLFENLDGASAGYEYVDLASSTAAAHYAYVRKDGA